MKKATLKTAIVIIALIFTFIIILGIFFQLWDKEKNITDENIENYDTSNRIEYKDIEVDAKIEELFIDFTDILQNSKGEACLVNYNGFPKEVKDNWWLYLAKLGDETFMQLFNNKKQLTLDSTITKTPCVVNAKSFYENCIKGNDCKNPENIREVEVKFQDNLLLFDGIKTETKDQNIMFQLDDKHVCFIPTRDGPAFGIFSGCTAYDNELNDKCINEIKKKISPCK